MISRRKKLLVFYAYTLLVIVIPLVILGLTGDLSISAGAAFMVGLLVAVLGENLLDQIIDGFSRLRRAFRDSWTQHTEYLGKDEKALYNYMGAWITGLGLLGWNMYFVGAAPLKEGTYDWVPLLAFFLAFILAP